MALRYAIVEYDAPRRIVLEAQRPGFVSRDTVTVESAGSGSVVGYDATLAFTGIGRLFDAMMQRVFNRVELGDDRDASGAELVTRSPAVNLVT